MRNQFKQYYQEFYKNDDDYEYTTVESLVVHDNLRIAGIAGMVYFLLNVYYLISDLVRDFYSTPHAWLNLVALLISIISSIYIIWACRSKLIKRNILAIRISLLFYYLCLIIMVTIFAYTMNIRAFEAGADSEYIGITLSTVYLITFVLSPLYRMSDSLILMVAMIIGMIITMILPGNEMFGFFRQISFRAIIIIAYFFFRNRNCKMATREIEINALNSQLMVSSNIDNLTGALNRNALDYYINCLVEKYQSDLKLSVIMFDIDFFKIYNDYYSHEKGDRILNELSQAVIDSLENDQYLFRFGGEEFLVMALNHDDEKLLKTALNIRAVINNLNIERKDNSKYDHLTISLGCTHLDINSDNSIGDYITEVDK